MRQAYEGLLLQVSPNDGHTPGRRAGGTNQWCSVLGAPLAGWLCNTAPSNYPVFWKSWQ